MRVARFFCAASIAGVLLAQAPYYSSIRAVDTAQDIPANRGSAAVWQLLQKLHTRASLIMLTAHPDDEDGGMLTFESRGRGTRVALLTLNRGEGGANVMSPDFFDGLGLVRTMELLEAGRHYGVDQYWTRVADYGFSKTKEEALGQWTHDRVLYDAVRVVRMVRPLVVTSVFVGGPSDGHGNHQVAGQMAAEVFKAAGDPNVFPDQIRAGLRPWSPVKYYARVPFGRRGASAGVAANVEIPAGDFDPMLGASYAQIAREGLGYQKSQNGGPSSAAAGPQNSAYHRYGSAVSAADKENSFFDGIDTSLMGIASMGGPSAQPFAARLQSLNAVVEEAMAKFNARRPEAIAPLLARGLGETNALLSSIAASSLSDNAKHDMAHELTIKAAQFQHALTAALGVNVSANVAVSTGSDDPRLAMFRGQPDTYRVAIPGQNVAVRVRVTRQTAPLVKLAKTYLATAWGGAPAAAVPAAGPVAEARFELTVPEDAGFTRPYFTRPTIDSPFYDKLDETYLNRPLAPYPVEAWAEFEYEGVTFRAGQVVQTTQRVTGLGTVSEPLVIGPPISVAISPRHGIVPLGAKSFPLAVTVRSHVKGPATGKVRLELPSGWKSSPAAMEFSTPADGAEQSLAFVVTPAQVATRSYDCAAVAEFGGKEYREGYQRTGYPGLRPYFWYRAATHKTAGVDVKVAPGLKAGYITGTGDEVPEALGNLGINVSFLSPADVASGDLSKFDVIVLGVRAYAAREDLKTNNARLLEYVNGGGVVIVQYNTQEYDHNYGPYPYTMGPGPEEVTDENSRMEILEPANAVFNWPNKISASDFSGWVEERGSKFLRSWDSRYTPLLSTSDPAQEPQKGGLLLARYGKGVYIYNAYAFYRQLPAGVPGAYRLFANLLSLARKP